MCGVAEKGFDEKAPVSPANLKRNLYGCAEIKDNRLRKV
jgi:hypothetical protein